MDWHLIILLTTIIMAAGLGGFNLGMIAQRQWGGRQLSIGVAVTTVASLACLLSLFVWLQ